MKLLRLAAIAIFAATAAHAQEREPAPPPQDPSLATIRGDVVSSFLGKTSSRVMYIDGRFLGGELETCDRHDLAPGPHSLVVAFKGRLMPLRLDAGPGDAFVVKWENDSDDTLYVVNEATGQTVFRRPLRDAENDPMSETVIGQITGTKAPSATYIEPSGPDSALVTAVPRRVNEFPFGERDEGRIEIVAIDGERLGDRVRSARVAAGARAMAFYLSFYVGTGADYQPIYGWAKVPVMLDAKPGATYALGYEAPQRGFGPQYISIWIEDTATGAIVVPKAAALVNVGMQFGGFSYREPTSFPAGKGQLKRPPPKPKLWCERER
ncbi:MAG: hypothetical protein KF765_07565 [Parvibaculaceae bacterium]|nr:hypothetical protein [Parvibaculaceae bacterium]